MADRARSDALRAGDTVALARLYADDFVMVTSTGQLRTKADQLRDIGSGAEACHPFLPGNLARISYAPLRSPTTEEFLSVPAPPMRRSVDFRSTLS